MRKQLTEHILSIIFVFFVFTILFFVLIKKDAPTSNQHEQNISKIININFIDFENDLHKALLAETVTVFYQQNSDSILNVIESYYTDREKTNVESLSNNNEITWGKISSLFLIYLKFVLVFVLVMGMTYYGVQTLGVLRFVQMKHHQPPLLLRAYTELKNIRTNASAKEIIEQFFHSVSLICVAFLKTVAYLVLFSPAYVIAYSFKTKFDTDSIIFMILLGMISNGLLITYTQKFYTFLISENRKGYVETAIVKNLLNDYSFSILKLPSIFSLKKQFPGHVFNHIYMNARYQYLRTLKEQAAFLISGLIIIEMALNIQNHLSYELLQNLLYENYLLVLLILFAIYLIVKITEIFIDVSIQRESFKYSNK